MRLTCKEATALISQALDRKLTAWERLILRLHLLVCDACSNFVKQSAFIRRALRRLSGGDEPRG
jgi:predicted anti-sigma-YlaC factor YlaD